MFSYYEIAYQNEKSGLLGCIIALQKHSLCNPPGQVNYYLVVSSCCCSVLPPW